MERALNLFQKYFIQIHSFIYFQVLYYIVLRQKEFETNGKKQWIQIFGIYIFVDGNKSSETRKENQAGPEL